MAEKIMGEKIGCLYKDLLPAKLYYLAQHYSYGNYVPYINLYFVSIGLTVSQAGLVNGLRQIVATLIALFIGFMADYTQKQKIITLIVMTSSILIAVPSPFVMALFNKNKNLNNSSSFMQRIVFNTTIDKHDEIITPPPIPFMIFWFGMVAGTGLSTMSLVERAVIVLLKKFDGDASYGMQRIFAPIGFTLGSFLTGIAIDKYSPSIGMNKYTVLFLSLIAPNSLVLLSTCALNMNYKPPNEKKPQEKSMRKAIFKTLRKLNIILFFITIFIAGLSFAVMSSYMLLLLENIESSKSMLGLTVAMSTISEIIIFPFSARLMEIIGSSFICFSIALFTYAFRFIIYFLSKQIWLIISSQLLHAFSHSLFWVAVNEYTYKEAPSNISQTLFSVINVLFYMISSVIANVAGGWLFEIYGGRLMFLIFAIICFIWGFVVTIYWVFITQISKKVKNEDALLEVSKLRESLNKDEM